MESLICFDWDGTLADSMDLCLKELALTMDRMKLPQLPDETYMLCNGPTIPDSVTIVHVPKERTEEYVQHRRRAQVELVPSCQKLFPGIKNMLEILQKRCSMAVVSNGCGPYVCASVEHTGVQSHFVSVRTAVEGKTKGQLLQQLLNDLKPKRAIMVGDRTGDFIAAHDCSLQAIACRYGCGCEDEFRHADAVVDTPQALQRLLIRWLDGEEIK